MHAWAGRVQGRTWVSPPGIGLRLAAPARRRPAVVRCRPSWRKPTRAGGNVGEGTQEAPGASVRPHPDTRAGSLLVPLTRRGAPRSGGLVHAGLHGATLPATGRDR